MSRRLISNVCRGCGASHLTRPSRAGGFCSRACAAAEGRKLRWVGQHDRLAERFWPLVDVRGPGECWPWLGRTDKDGYGLFKALGRQFLVHRVAFGLHVGRPPEAWVLHRCDNRPCCNPGHHFEGDVLDNNADRVAKGRSAAILSPAAVYEIRGSRGRNVDLAQQFSVDPSTISRTRRGLRWSHVL